MQATTLKRYDAPLTLSTLICFVGTLQAIVVTFAMERDTSVWRIGFDMNLLAAAYAVSTPFLARSAPPSAGRLTPEHLTERISADACMSPCRAQ
jgi:hypothetical protein